MRPVLTAAALALILTVPLATPAQAVYPADTIRAVSVAHSPTVRHPGFTTAQARNRSYARIYIRRHYHWGTHQWGCLRLMWQHESGWSARIRDPHRAGGIPQALPATKMARFGSIYNYRTQVKFGAHYISKRYGTPCTAWQFWQTHSPGWY